MNLLTKFYIKQMIKKIDKDIKVKFGNNLQCLPTEGIIYIGFNNSDIENITFLDFIKELDSTCQFDDLLLGILHEIGHIYTYEEDDEDDYNNNLDLLQFLYKTNLINEKQLNEAYLRLDLEQKATKWAIEFTKANPDFCKKYQRKITGGWGN